MSKERLTKIFNDYIEDYNWLCYEYDKDFNGFHLYKNSNKVAEFFLDEYDLVMTGGINTSTQIEKAIRVVIASYIVQEEELRNKKFYLRLKYLAIHPIYRYLIFDKDYGDFTISVKFEGTAKDVTCTYTESDIEKFKEEIDGFSELLKLFEKEYVED